MFSNAKNVFKRLKKKQPSKLKYFAWSYKIRLFWDKKSVKSFFFLKACRQLGYGKPNDNQDPLAKKDGLLIKDIYDQVPISCFPGNVRTRKHILANGVFSSFANQHFSLFAN